jgi:hypothetical protein
MSGLQLDFALVKCGIENTKYLLRSGLTFKNKRV